MYSLRFAILSLALLQFPIIAVDQDVPGLHWIATQGNQPEGAPCAVNYREIPGGAEITVRVPGFYLENTNGPDGITYTRISITDGGTYAPMEGAPEFPSNPS